MQDLVSVFNFLSTVIGLFLTSMLSHWYTTILIFIMVLGGIVGVLLVLRGSK